MCLRGIELFRQLVEIKSHNELPPIYEYLGLPPTTTSQDTSYGQGKTEEGFRSSDGNEKRDLDIGK